MRSSRSLSIATLIALAGLLVAAGAGAIVAGGPNVLRAIPFSVAFLAVTGLALLLTVRGVARCRASVRAGTGVACLGTTIVGMVTLVAVSVPAYQLATGARQSKLDSLGLPEINPRGDATADCLIFVIALLGFAVGEWLAQRTVPRRSAEVLRKAPRRIESRGVYFVLVGMSLLSFAIGGGQTLQQSLTARGTVAGQGPLQLLGVSPALAVVIGVLCGHWHDRRLIAVSVGLTLAMLFLGGTRTPLAIIGMTLLVKLIVDSSSTQHPFALGIALLLAGYIATVLLVSISAWRGAVRSGAPTSLVSEIRRTAPDPITGLSAGGLDTVDGLSLATTVSRARVGATVLDPVKAVIEFVPRQIWPSKPDFLSSTVSHDYTDFGGRSGIFLSGPGYGFIVFGGRLPMMLMFIVIAFVAEAIYRKQRGLTVWTALVTYFLARFVVAGDAFDLFNVLGLVLVCWFAYLAYGFCSRERRAYLATRTLAPPGP